MRGNNRLHVPQMIINTRISKVEWAFYLGAFLLVACCTKPTEQATLGSKGEWPVQLKVAKLDEQRLIATIENQSSWPITTKLTTDQSLTYGGVYAYDSIFCAELKPRLSVVSDFFNTRFDTIYAGQVKKYNTALYSPFVSDVLDSTSIYSFSFKSVGPDKVKYIKYLVSARGEGGVLSIRDAANELIDSSGHSVEFKLEKDLCGSSLLTKEVPF